MEGFSKSGTSCDVRLDRSDAKSYLKKSDPVDLVFIDPPYGMAHNQILTLLGALNLSDPGTEVLELPRNDETPALEGFFLQQEKSYGDTKVVFLVRDAAQ